MTASGKTTAWALAVGVFLGHVSGVLVKAEEEVSPSLAHASFDWFDWLDAGGFGSAKSALQELAKGSNEDKIVRRATCGYLNGTQALSPVHADIVRGIDANVPFVYRNMFGLKAVESSVANKLQGLSGPGSYSHLYMAACFGKAE